MSLDCPEITKMILDIIYGDEGEGNGISTISKTALYSDYEAISSDEVSMVEKGEIDSTPTMQNTLKPKKQKTVTEIIHDQLGPGYVPRGHKGGR